MIKTTKNSNNENLIEINEDSLNPKDEKSHLTYTQSEGYTNLEQFLFDSLSYTTDNIEEKGSHSYCGNYKENFTHQHNTIFVNGKRGSGKTQFLLSIENYIKEIEDNRAKDFYFIQPIDPTLLHDNENFLTIILAKILNELEVNCRLQEFKNDDKKKFYQLLSDVSKAIDGTILNKNFTNNSLENIAQDQTSLKLSRLMHEFFELLLKMQNKQKIVILIDDIDMALDKGFEVLEVIRKYLSSPHIIPIVTGDIDLYTPLVENHFLNSLVSLKENLYPSNRMMRSNNDLKKEEIINILLASSQDYLIKVFPMHRRIKIKTFWELAEKNTICFEFNKQIRQFTRKNSKEINSKNHIEFDINFDSTIKDFKEELTENLFNLSARSIIQIFKRELTDNPKEFLTNIQNIKAIHYNYNYEILSTKNMITKYKDMIDSNITKKAYKEANEILDKVIELDKKDYTVFDSLGLVNYEIVTKYNRQIGEKINLTKPELFYKKSINSYIQAIELYKISQRNRIDYRDRNEDFISSIENDLVQSYLELLEYYLINNSNDFIGESKKFLKLFNREKRYMKVFKMFEILFTKDELQLKLEDWQLSYGNIHFQWNFEELKLWVDEIESDELKDVLQSFQSFFIRRRI